MVLRSVELAGGPRFGRPAGAGGVYGAATVERHTRLVRTGGLSRRGDNRWPIGPQSWNGSPERKRRRLQTLEDNSTFSATLDEAARLWDDRGADFRAEKVLALSEIIQETAPDLVWLYGPYLHLYIGCMIKVGVVISQGEQHEAEAVALKWRPYPIHLAAGNPLIVKRLPDGVFTCTNPESTEKKEHWDQWRGFLRALRPEGKSGRPEGRKDSRPRKQKHAIEPGMAGEAYRALARGVSKKKVIATYWPDLDNSDGHGYAKLRNLIAGIVAERGPPQRGMPGRDNSTVAGRPRVGYQ